MQPNKSLIHPWGAAVFFTLTSFYLYGSVFSASNPVGPFQIQPRHSQPSWHYSERADLPISTSCLQYIHECSDEFHRITLIMRQTSKQLLFSWQVLIRHVSLYHGHSFQMDVNPKPLISRVVWESLKPLISSTWSMLPWKSCWTQSDTCPLPSGGLSVHCRRLVGLKRQISGLHHNNHLPAGFFRLPACMCILVPNLKHL